MAFRIRDARGAALWAGGALPRRARRAARWRPPTSRSCPGAAGDRRAPASITRCRSECAPATIMITLEPLFDDQELDARAGVGTVYWEGAVRARSTGDSAGRGYLELTGYGEPLKLGS